LSRGRKHIRKHGKKQGVLGYYPAYFLKPSSRNFRGEKKMSALEPLWQRGKNFLGVSYPIIAGAMTWISDSHFVSAVCNEGAFGCLAAGNMEPSLLDLDNTNET
jgi:hypothetical protein